MGKIDTDWIPVSEMEPIATSPMPLWWWDGQIVGMGTYHDRPPGFEDTWGDDGWQTGLVHDEITHWMRVERKSPPVYVCEGFCRDKFYSGKTPRDFRMATTDDPERDGWTAVIPGDTEDRDKWSWLCPKCAKGFKE